MLHDRHAEWLKEKGLDPVLAEKLGIFTSSDGDGNWLCVPIVERGQQVTRKEVRTRDGAFRLPEGSPLCLWNHDLLLDPKVQSGEQPVVIAREVWEGMALMSCGIMNVVAVPNGAGVEESSGPIDPAHDNARFGYLWRSRSLLDNVGSFILAMGSDEPGRVLAAELARRLGPERCQFVEYPFGAGRPMNELTELLVTFGQAAVVETIAAAKPYPVKNIFRMSDFPTPPEMQTLSHGIPGLADHLPIVPQTLTVCTGFAGAGKTSLIAGIIANLMKRGSSVCMGSFETIPKPILERRLRASLIGCAEHSLPVTRIGEADRIIEEHLTVIAQLVDEDEELTLDDLLELCRIAVLRDGARVIVIDPWNEIEHKRRGDESDHDYTGRAIRAIKTFMRRYDVAVWVVVHPRKPDLSGAKPRLPTLYDASGSAHWANKADYGLIIHRPDKSSNIVDCYISKVRMGLPGKEGKVQLAYDWRFSEYTPALAPEDVA